MTIHASEGPNEKQAACLFRQIFSVRTANVSSVAPWADLRPKIFSHYAGPTKFIDDKAQSDFARVGGRVPAIAAIRVPNP